MAAVDSKTNFLAVDIGSYGKNSDGGTFGNSLFGQVIANTLISKNIFQKLDIFSSLLITNLLFLKKVSFNCAYVVIC